MMGKIKNYFAGVMFSFSFYNSSFSFQDIDPCEDGKSGVPGSNPPGVKKKKRRVLFSKAQTYELERRFRHQRYKRHSGE